MTGKYRAYPEYWESHQLGLESLPKSWAIKRIKHLFRIGRGRVISQEELDENGQYPVYSSQTQNNGCLGYIDTFDFDCRQITWTTDGANAGTVFVRDGKHNCTNVCGTLQSSGEADDLGYFYFCLLYVTQFHKRPDTNGAKIMNNEMAEIAVPLPSVAEREKIVVFLKVETAKIDTLIEKQQQLIKLLKEKRQAVISHAVTKGLNPNVPMKDSGVEWLGEVPAHWVVCQFKTCTLEMQTGPFGSQLHAEDYVEDGIPLVNPAHIVDGKIVPESKSSVDVDTGDRLSRHRLEVGDLILARRGELGRCAVVTMNEVGWLCGTGSLKAKLNDRLIPEYAYQLISSDGVKTELSLESKGSTMDNLNTETLGRIRLPIPPVGEQLGIIKAVDEAEKKFQRLFDKANQQISLLQERRTALISAAVTGKIDVRDWQPPASANTTPNL